jgi:hypothetical protein
MAVDLWNLLENKRLVYCWKVGTKIGWESHRDSGLVQQQGFAQGNSVKTSKEHHFGLPSPTSIQLG